MNWQIVSRRGLKRLTSLGCVLALFGAEAAARALTTVQFEPIRAALSNEVTTLSALEDPTSKELKRLRTLLRASGVLTNTALADGKALHSLLTILKNKTFPAYTPLLETTAANLRQSFENKLEFVVTLMPELPESTNKAVAQKQLKALTPLSNKLITTEREHKIATLLDPVSRRMEALLLSVAEALIPPFPEDLSRNTISARVNGVNMRVSRDHATENYFSVTATETNFTIYCSAVDGTVSSQTGGRGLILSVSNVLNGLTMYPVPSQATITFRSGVYSGTETATSAASGSVFVSTEGPEIFGVFTAAGPGLSITNGRFRLDLPTP